MENYTDKCIGSLLGTCIGDILGAPVEGYSFDRIAAAFAQIEKFIPSKRGFGHYTDDTQMTIALAISLVRCSGINPEDCAKTYAELYDPGRGYGGSASRILKALQAGADYQHTAGMQFKEGSFGNGGAMRIAPVGLVYRDKDEKDLRQAVFDAIMCTHVHPEAIDGAFIQAKAVGIMANTENVSGFDPYVFLKTLHGIAQTEVLRAKLEELKRIIEYSVPDRDAVKILGNGVRTSESVSCSLLAVCRYYNDPANAITKAVSLGGDTDTIAAMAGAQIGALHGSKWIPAYWFDNIENGRYGRDEIIAIAKQLSGIIV